MNQKMMATFLVGGIALMGGAGVAAANSMASPNSHIASNGLASAGHQPPSSDRMEDAASLQAPLTPTTTTARVSVTTVKPAPMKYRKTRVIAPATTIAARTTLSPVTYTVKSGDNLSSIAWWFKVHGYSAIYNANKAAIGANPNLILPGLRITITGGLLSMGG